MVTGCSGKTNEEPLSGATGPVSMVGPGAGAAAALGGSGRTASGAAGVGIGPDGTVVGAAGFGAAGVGGGAAGSGPVVGPGSSSVLQYHANAKRDGMYVDAAFTRVAAAMIKRDPTFNAAIMGPTYAQPLYVEKADGNDLIITATSQNQVSAINATTGVPLWQMVLAPPGEPGCGGSVRPLGVTGTPIVDAESNTLYVAAMTMGGKHQIFALSLTDGSVVPGWPVDVGTIKAGATAFNPAFQNQRGALLIVNKTLYVPYGGNFQDCGDFHGWVVGVPLANPAAPIAFATKGIGAGIWGPGGLASDGVSVFAATGNTMEKGGASNTSPAAWGHGNSVLRLAPTLSEIAEGQTLDFFSTKSWKEDDKEGFDLGSSGPVLFSMPGSTPADLVLAMGKSGSAFVLDAAKLGGIGGELSALKVTEGGIAGGMIQAAAVYPTPGGTFAAFRSTQLPMMCASGMGNFAALKITAGAPPKLSMGWCTEGYGTGSPIVTSTDGMTDSIVWFFTGGKLVGVNGENGTSVYRAAEDVGFIDKYQTPIVAKGRLFVAGTDAVYAFTLK
jgi:outer membrane protein assembly factor BamB